MGATGAAVSGAAGDEAAAVTAAGAFGPGDAAGRGRRVAADFFDAAGRVFFAAVAFRVEVAFFAVAPRFFFAAVFLPAPRVRETEALLPRAVFCFRGAAFGDFADFFGAFAFDFAAFDFTAMVTSSGARASSPDAVTRRYRAPA